MPSFPATFHGPSCAERSMKHVRTQRERKGIRVHNEAHRIPVFPLRETRRGAATPPQSASAPRAPAPGPADSAVAPAVPPNATSYNPSPRSRSVRARSPVSSVGARSVRVCAPSGKRRPVAPGPPSIAAPSVPSRPVGGARPRHILATTMVAPATRARSATGGQSPRRRARAGRAASHRRLGREPARARRDLGANRAPGNGLPIGPQPPAVARPLRVDSRSGESCRRPALDPVRAARNDPSPPLSQGRATRRAPAGGRARGRRSTRCRCHPRS